MAKTKKKKNNSKSERGEDMAATAHLSDDTLLLIFSHISTRDLLSRLALVCRRWLRLVKSHPVRELVPCVFSPYDRPWGFLSEEAFLKLWSCHSNSLERVSLNGFKLDVNHIVPLIVSCPNLNDLSIVSYPLLASHDLENIANILPSHLISLDFHVPDQFIWKVPDICDGVVDTVSHRCPYLEKLDLDNCIKVSRECLSRFLDLKMSIKSLDLWCDAIGWPELANIFVSLQQLQHLSIVSSKLNDPLDDSDDEDNLLDRRRTRSRMNLKNRKHSSSFSWLESYGTFPPHLSSLRLYHSPHHSVSFSSAPSSTLLKDLGPQLHYLHAQNVLSRGYHTISVWCAHLETLDLSRARNEDLQLTGIEEVILCGLPRLLKNLKRIALPVGCDNVLVELGQFCRKLKEVRIEGFGSINYNIRTEHPVTDRGVMAIAEGCLELEVLSLSGCSKVTDLATRALALKCRKLKILHLCGCYNLTDIGVTLLLHELNSSLSLLDLVDCIKITKGVIASISVLAKLQGSSIRVLAISNCLWESSQAEIMKLKMYAPHLSVRVGSSKIPWNGFYHS